MRAFIRLRRYAFIAWYFHMAALGGVRNLRSKYGWPIQTKYRGPENIAHYWLPDGCRWGLLRFPLSAGMLKDEHDGNAVRSQKDQPPSSKTGEAA